MMETSMTSDHTSLPPRNQGPSRIPKKRPSRTFWIKELAEFSKSGLSVQQFCSFKAFSPSNFYTWRKRLQEEESNTPPAPATFIPLEVRAADNSPVPLKKELQSQRVSFSPAMEKAKQDAGLSLHLNNGLKISVDRDFHGPTLQRLVQICSPTGPETC